LDGQRSCWPAGSGRSCGCGTLSSGRSWWRSRARNCCGSDRRDGSCCSRMSSYWRRLRHRCRRWLRRQNGWLWRSRSNRMRNCSWTHSSRSSSWCCRTRGRRRTRNDGWSRRTRRNSSGRRCGSSRYTRCRSSSRTLSRSERTLAGRRGSRSGCTSGGRTRGLRFRRGRFCRLGCRFLLGELVEVLSDQVGVGEVE
jgi:hypothetical protein